MPFKLNIKKAKVIAHDMRRKKRDHILKPLDLQVTIPGLEEDIEAERAVYREKDAKIQIAIDKVKTEAQLSKAVKPVLPSGDF